MEKKINTIALLCVICLISLLYFGCPFGPEDLIPCSEVTGLSISAGVNQLIITWTNPGDGDFDHVRILFKKESDLLYTTFSGVVDSSGTLLTELDGGVTYTIRVQTVDSSGNISSGSDITGTPIAVDTTAPQEVSAFSIDPDEAALVLSWTNPEDADFDRVDISYKQSSADSFEWYSGNTDPFGTVISGLTELTSYDVRIRTVDTSNNMSDGVTDTAVTESDIDPPDVSDVSIIAASTEIVISWTYPDIPDFDHAVIRYSCVYHDEYLYDGEINPAGTTLSDLYPDTEYTISIYVIDSAENSSSGTLDTVTTEGFSLGSTGPAGGLICYIDESDNYPWKYLSAAPVSWRALDNHTFIWAASTDAPGEDGLNYSAITIATEDTMNSGEPNTQAIVERLPNPSWFPFAADVCSSLTYEGFSDWFLPSAVQLKEAYNVLHDRLIPAGSFEDDEYWTSVQSDPDDYPTRAEFVDFSDGTSGMRFKDNALLVRPMRTFTNYFMLGSPDISTEPDTDVFLPGTIVTVTITCDDEDADIYYTLDDTEPTRDDTLYTGPFSITTGSETGDPVRTIAVKAGYDDSLTVVKTLQVSSGD